MLTKKNIETMEHIMGLNFKQVYDVAYNIRKFNRNEIYITLDERCSEYILISGTNSPLVNCKITKILLFWIVQHRIFYSSNI